jgi:predicted amidohydrolase YtcJ
VHNLNIGHLARSLLAAFCIIMLSSVAMASERSPADMIVVNAQIKTMDDKLPLAQAFAIGDGRILAVGSRFRVEKLRGPKTVVLDAEGRTITPGFIDTHMHPGPAFDEMSPQGRLQVSAQAGVTSLAAFYEKLAAKVRATPPGMPIVARGYSELVLGKHPLAVDLDKVVPNNPLVVIHSSGHRLVANTAALRLAGITRTTPDPNGGKFERGPDGEANGIVLETAQAALRVPALELPAASQSELIEAYQRQFRQFLSYGITGVAAAGTDQAEREIFRELVQSGMPVTIHAMVKADDLGWLIDHRHDPAWAVGGLTLGTVKIFAGNSFSGRTALLDEPYANPPDYHGLEPALGPAALNALVLKAHQAGIQVAVHANGDREIERVITAIERAQAAKPGRQLRHRIEHASVMTAPLLARIKAAGICIAPHSYIRSFGAVFEDYGASRFDWMEPNRRALDAGVCIGGNSDHPVSFPRVMDRIESLVTRRALSNGKVYGASQRLTPDEALRSYTMGSAYLQFEEKDRGSITRGKRADFVVLSADPAAVEPDRIQDIKVLQTYVKGKCVFDAGKGC